MTSRADFRKKVARFEAATRAIDFPPAVARFLETGEMGALREYVEARGLSDAVLQMLGAALVERAKRNSSCCSRVENAWLNPAGCKRGGAKQPTTALLLLPSQYSLLNGLY